MMDTTNLLHWIEEREAIRICRASGAPPPWTDDPILRDWSFCNVRREDDRTTRWIAENWRDPHADDPDLFFAMGVARFVNLPDTLDEIGYPVPWNRDRFLQVTADRKRRGVTVFGPAYNISNGGCAIAKNEHVVERVLDPLWRARKRLRPRADDCLLSFCARLQQERGFREFMAAQIVADMKYAPPLDRARDWMTFARSGPGSQRGLNRVLGRPVKQKWKEDNWFAAFSRLHHAVTPELERVGITQLHAQDLQNCLCEFDKYERARLGEGKPKRRFAPRPPAPPKRGPRARPGKAPSSPIVQRPGK
jgi:hypothetical protein